MSEQTPQQIARDLCTVGCMCASMLTYYKCHWCQIVAAIQIEREAREKAEKICEETHADKSQVQDLTRQAERIMRERDESKTRAEKAEAKLRIVEEMLEDGLYEFRRADHHHTCYSSLGKGACTCGLDKFEQALKAIGEEA